jgi:acyl-CoA reductase-like NAD-dependent aldehyde dehydrogenase
MSTDIIIIHEAIAPKFLETLKQALSAAQAASKSLPLVVSSNSAARITEMVTDATKKGAELFHGAPVRPEGKAAQVIPTVVGGVSKEMELWKEEAFGPLTGYLLVANEDEAVELANSSGYGLSAAIFTRDLRKGFALAKRIKSGYLLPLDIRDFANV